MRKFSAGLVLGTAIVLLMQGTAFAEPTVVSVGAGPVPVPNVPVEACVDDECESTPALSSVSLDVEASSDVTSTPPTITPGTCASGTGIAFVVQTGSDQATVRGEVSGTLPDGSLFSEPVGPVTVPADESATVSACTSATPPITPEPDPAGGLLGLLLNLLSSLLGGL